MGSWHPPSPLHVFINHVNYADFFSVHTVIDYFSLFFLYGSLWIVFSIFFLFSQKAK